MWVSAPQVSLRDRVATLYNKTGIVRNAERVEVLEKQKRFARVRSADGEEGWIEQRYLVDQSVFNGFQKLVDNARPLAIVGFANTRSTLNMHLSPGRDAEVLWQLHEGEKVEILKRGVGEKPVAGAKKLDEGLGKPKNEKSAMPAAQVKTTSSKSAARPAIKSAIEKRREAAATEPVMEDWWLVRSGMGRVGWVLGRMLDFDIPLDIAQYSEGQRIIGCFVINVVQAQDKKVAQWLALVTDSKDGLPYDFNQIRVFTWNLKRHRYETAYRERRLFGMLPVKVDKQDFGKEGVLPVFTIHVQDASGQMFERTYRLAGTMVRRVLPEDQNTNAATANQGTAPAPARRSRRRRS